MLNQLLLCSLVGAAGIPTTAGASVFAANPFTWDTVQDKLYSFCYGDSLGPLDQTEINASEVVNMNIWSRGVAVQRSSLRAK